MGGKITNNKINKMSKDNYYVTGEDFKDKKTMDNRCFKTFIMDAVCHYIKWFLGAMTCKV